MLSTLWGTGTKFYGKKAADPDGLFTTTNWLTVLYIPVLPLSSHRILLIGGPQPSFGFRWVKTTQRYFSQQIAIDWGQIIEIYLKLAAQVFSILLWIRYSPQVFRLDNDISMFVSVIGPILLYIIGPFYLYRAK